MERACIGLTFGKRLPIIFESWFDSLEAVVANIESELLFKDILGPVVDLRMGRRVFGLRERRRDFRPSLRRLILVSS